MNRITSWRAGLEAVIEAHRGHAFEWGAHDCGIFFADAVEAMTGVDLAEQFRGRYRSARGASRVVRRAGFGDHIAYVASRLPEIEKPSHAGRGDGAVVDSDDGPALGIVIGPLIAVYGHRGIGFVPFADAVRAFKVG